MKTTALNATVASAIALGLFACGGLRPASDDSVGGHTETSSPAIPSPSPTPDILHAGTYIAVGSPSGQEEVATAPRLSLPGRIVFLSDRSGNPDIYMMDANGTNQRAMGATPEYEINPVGVPSGQIFFTADYRGDREIYSVFTTTGFNPTKWTVSPGMDVITDVARGGFPILFWSQRDSVEGFEGPLPEIYMMNMAAEETRLTNNTTSDTCAAWSADMSQIGYSSCRYDYESVRIVVMNADGSDPRDLIDTPADDHCPQWSPDGVSIAFYTEDPACFPAQCGELWLMDPDGTDAHPLDIFEGPAVFRDVGWSPDGKWLVFSADVGAGSDVYLVRPDGSDLMILTQDSPANDWGADWYTLR